MEKIEAKPLWNADPDAAARHMMAAFRAMRWEFDDGDFMNSLAEMLAFSVNKAFDGCMDVPVGVYKLTPSSLYADLRAIARAADKIYQ